MKTVTVRCLLSIVSVNCWPFHQIDVNNVFSHGDFDEEVCMQIPPRFSCQGKNRVCKLQKASCGLKQASHNWFSKFCNALLAVAYSQLKADYSLFTKITNVSATYVLVYVGDILITRNDKSINLLKIILR